MRTRPYADEQAAVVPDQRELWDRWHEHHTHASHRNHADRARDRFMSALSADKPCTVLELGCGQGRDALELALTGHTVYGLDHSVVALGRACRRAAVNRIALRLMSFDYAEALPFPDAFFDGVYAHLALHYFNKEDAQCVFNDILRVLKPDGVLYFTVRSTTDPLYGDGDRIGSDMYCRLGQVRHFFSIEFTNRLLKHWRVKSVAGYDTEGETTNPGHFIEGVAYRPTLTVQTLSVGAQAAKAQDLISALGGTTSLG